MPRPKNLRRWKILAGQHIGPDYTQDPVDVRNPLTGEKTGEKYPSRTFTAGQVCLDHRDLLKALGPNKVQALDHPEAGGRRVRGTSAEPPLEESFTPGDTAPAIPAVAPHGQVSTGHQEATSLPGGRTVSGPVTEGDPARRSAGDAGMRTAGGGGPVTPEEMAEVPSDEEPSGPADDDLESMTVEDLRQLAADEDHNLHGASTKKDIVKGIKASRRAKARGGD